MKIREAQYADSATLAEIQVASYQYAYRGVLPDDYLARFSVEEQTQDWKDLIANMVQGGIKTDEHGKTPVPFLLVAEDDDGEVVGYALGHTGDSGLAGYDSELDALHVRRTLQRQGVGQLLVRSLAGYLQASGAASMLVWVLKENPARALYERMGGELVGHRGVTLGTDSVLAEEIAYGWRWISDIAGAVK